MRPGLPCAVEQVGDEALARRGLPRLQSQPGQEGRTGHEAHRVEGVDPAGLEGGDQDAGQSGPDDVRRALGDLQQRIGLLQPRVADRLGDEARRRRPEERLRRTEHAEVTTNIQISIASVSNATATTAWTAARIPSQASITSRRGRRSAQTPPTTMKLARASVNDARTRPSSALAAGLDHRERQRHEDHGVSDGGGRLSQPQQPELPLLERSQPAHSSSLDTYPCGASFRFCPAKGMQRKELVTVASIRQRP